MTSKAIFCIQCIQDTRSCSRGVGDLNSNWGCELKYFFGCAGDEDRLSGLLHVRRAAAVTAFGILRAWISHSPILQDLPSSGKLECHLPRQRCGISDSDSNSYVSPAVSRILLSVYLANLDLVHIFYSAEREVVTCPEFWELHWGWVCHRKVIGVTGTQAHLQPQGTWNVYKPSTNAMSHVHQALASQASILSTCPRGSFMIGTAVVREL
jgi:hypothetical protein